MLLPKKTKQVFERNRLYLKIRYSKWVHAFWLLLRADVRKELSAKKAFYNWVLPRNCRLIFDIGANEGTLTEVFGQHSQRVIAVEPSQRNISILSAKFHKQKNISLVAKAVSKNAGYQQWFEDNNDFAMGTLSRKWNDSKQNRTGSTTTIVTITIDDLIKEFGLPDYIKIDVEGHEWQVLQGLSQPVSLLSFEAILPQFLEETVLCIQHLRSLNLNTLFNYSMENRFVHNSYQTPDKVLIELQNIRQTIDVFCKL